MTKTLNSHQEFRAAALRELALVAQNGGPFLMEPIMSLELEISSENLGRVLGSLQQKRGRIEGLDKRGDNKK